PGSLLGVRSMRRRASRWRLSRFHTEHCWVRLQIRSIARWSQAGLVLAVAALAGRHIAAVGVPAAESPIAASCLSSAHREFDFWVGDWDVFDAGSLSGANSTKVARARVDLILDGCVLREDYRGTDGHRGQSFTIYDDAR